MTPLFILFTATGVMFWVLLAVMSVVIITSLEYDSPRWATTTLLITAGLVWFFSDFSYRYHFEAIDWRYTLVFVGVYLVCGVIWSFLKWYFHLAERRELWKEALTAYRDQYQLPDNTTVSTQDPKLAAFLRTSGRFAVFVPDYAKNLGEYRIRVRPRPDRGEIIAWMAYWPWSLVWSILDDFVRNLFRTIYRHLSGVYEGMAKAMFRGLED